MKTTLLSKVVLGKIVLSDEQKLKVKEITEKLIDGFIFITFDSDIHARSKAQNNFFHGVVIPATMRILREHGHRKWRNQEYVKEAILKKPFLTINAGEIDEYIRHTSALTINEMWKFINQCLVLMADLGGRLTAEEQEQYNSIIAHYGLGDGIDSAIERNL